MTPAGERAYEENKGKSGVYAYENELKELAGDEETLFRENAAAWADWEKRPPGYRRVVLHWIASAKRPETRAKRLEALIRKLRRRAEDPGYDTGKKK